MADIIPLPCSPHERAEALLPWYANGTLDASDAALVEAHLPTCAECRDSLHVERALAAQIASMPMDMEHGWAKMVDRLDAPPSRVAPVELLRRKVAVGWVVAGQVASAAALLFGLYVVVPTEPSNPTYRALGSEPTTEPGNVLVIFQPDVSERAMRAALLQTDARLVDGPNTSGAYVLRVAPASRGDALRQLRAFPQILLAEPVDAGNSG